MAEMTAGSQAAQHTSHTPHSHDDPAPGRQAGNIVALAGAALSLALVIGVGVWGYKIVMRDVTGVPVVRAMQGEMRVAPDNPGGEIAAHTGLSVNAVLAEGGAAAPEDRLVLAPAKARLQDEDLAVTPAAAEDTPEEAVVQTTGDSAQTTGDSAQAAGAAPAPRPETDTPTEFTTASAGGEDTAPGESSLSADEVLALADQVAADVEPLSELPEGENAPVQLSVNAVGPDDILDPGVPGVAESLRPQLRPASLRVDPQRAGTSEAAAAPETSEAAAPTLTGPLPAGTKLVQLGAFDSPDIAAREWTRVADRFGDFMGGKSRVIQEAQSGGRTLYRLRAQGFEDLSDARRFCAALVAEDAPCIPVVVR
jgi:hypothetical protein